VVRWLTPPLAVLVALTGCGISAETEPTAIEPPAPYQGFVTSAPPVDPSADPSAMVTDGPLNTVLYFTREERLVAVARPADTLPSVAELLQELSAGPNRAEREDGLVSALTGTGVLAEPDFEDGIVTVPLTEGVDGVAPAALVLIIAQIVCTLDAYPGAEGVVFSRDGQRVAVPRGDGSSTSTPLTTADYQELIAPS
jgi:spore germination protein GerM